MPKKKKINWERAFKLVALCHSTEGNIDYYIKWFGYDKYMFVEDQLTDTELHCFADGKEIVIIAQGSDSFTDWFWNIAAIGKVKTSFGKVHSGFYLAVKRLLEKKDFMDFIESNEGAIYLAGFSKGGAIVTVMAPYLFRVKEIYTFGSPRVGDWNYAKNYPMINILFAFKNSNDLIPHLPPIWFWYKHIDSENFEFKKGRHGAGEYYRTVSETFYETRK